MPPLTLHGRVVTGIGAGASFTRLDWARRQFIDELGIDPHPGTLNLALEGDAAHAAWQALCREPGRTLQPDDPRWCAARGYPVRIAGRLPAAIVRPEVEGYPATQVEVICALPLRTTLALADGDLVTLEVTRELPVRGVIFDVDGTLLDTLEAYRIVAEQAVAPLGLAVSRAVVCEALNTQSLFWELVLPAGYPDRAQVMKRLSQAAYAAWPAVLQQHGRIYPGLRETLDGLRAQGACLGVVTGSRLPEAHPLRTEGYLEAFGAVVTGADDVRSKPDPEGLLRCAEALGIAPGDAVYIGDTPVDVAAARAAGMGAVAVLTGAGDAAQLAAAGADWILPSLDALGRAIVRIR